MKSVLRVLGPGFSRAFSGFLGLLMLFGGLCVSLEAGAETEGETTRSRWVAPFSMEVPATWKPLVEQRQGVLYFTGAVPDMMDKLGEDVPILALGTMQQPAPREGGYETFLDMFASQAQKEGARNFSSRREDITLGGKPGVLLRFSGEAEMEGTYRKVGGAVGVVKEPDPQGNYTVVMVMGNSSGLEGYEKDLSRILGSARSEEPPLKLEQSFVYGATSDQFRYTFGLAAASDGTVALGDSRNGTIRLLDSQGAVAEEWGRKAKGEEGTFSYPRDLAFAPDGSLWVADEGYSVQAHLQHFSRKGAFLRRIALSPKVLGEDKGIYKPSFVRITPEGKICVAGMSDISDGRVRILVFDPSGTLLTVWEPEKMGKLDGMEVLPEGNLLLADSRPEGSRGGLFLLYSPEGKKLREWPFYGTDLEATPGDEKIYFRPEHLGTDDQGRIYAYDDGEDSLWIYDSDGVFLQALPLDRRFGIIMGMTASPQGDVIVQERRGKITPGGEPALHILKNRLASDSPGEPASPPPAALPEELMGTQEETMLPEPPLEITPGPKAPSPEQKAAHAKKEALQEELQRLKRALVLREQGLEHERGGELAKALGAYRESLPLHPDAGVEARIRELEDRSKAAPSPVPPVTAAPPEPAVTAPEVLPEEKAPEPAKAPESLPEAPEILPALSLPAPPPLPDLPPEPTSAPTPAPVPFERAKALEEQGRGYEALQEYRKELKSTPDPEILDHIRELELALRREARNVVAQAVTVQNQGNYRRALELYRESLAVYPLERVKEYADRLEIILQEGQNLRSRAENLWRQGAELEKNWKYEEALKKYREGLALVPDPKVEAHVKKLEAFLGK